MPLIVNSAEKKDRGNLAPGSYIGRVYMVVALGTHVEKFQGSNEEKRVTKVLIGWELPTELRVFKEGEDPKPLVVSREYNPMFESKAFKNDIDGMMNVVPDDERKSFDIYNVIGRCGLISVSNKTSKTGKAYNVVNSIVGLVKGLTPPDPILDVIRFDFDENFDNLNILPEWIQAKIKTSEEYIKKTGGGVGDDSVQANQSRKDPQEKEVDGTSQRSPSLSKKTDAANASNNGAKTEDDLPF